MKILVVSSFLPFPLYSGGHIRLFNLIKELSKNHEITLVCEKRDYQTQTDIHALEKFCQKVVTVQRQKQWSVKNILASGFSDKAFLIIGHTLPEMKKRIAELLRENTYDLIHCETSYVFQNIPKTTLPVVIVEHNIEYAIYEKFAKQKGKLLGSLLGIDVFKLKRIEESFWKSAKIVVAVSKKEEEIIQQHARDTAVVPNGVDLSSFSLKHTPFSQMKKTLLYIGDFSYIQNQDAAAYLLSEIYPLIKKKDTSDNITLWIVGRKIPQKIKQLTNDPSVRFDENATQPTSDIFSDAALLLAPLRVGGGTQYKILESLAVGTPVITTSLGKEGLLVNENVDILVGDSPAVLADKAYDLLQNEALYERLSKNGRTLIEKQYSWTEIAHKLEQVYLSVVK